MAIGICKSKTITTGLVPACLFTIGLALTVLSLPEIFYLVFKPVVYENMIAALGKNYILRLIIGPLSLAGWYLMQKSKPVE